MEHQYFLDESGNTGDLVKLPPDLSFANQPFFSLACVGVDSCEKLDNHIEKLKQKYKIQGEELKAKNLYKSKPRFILELFEHIIDEKLPFYIEVVDKKYCIAVSIVNHQVIPPYVKLFETERQIQGLRNELAGYLSEHLPFECYKLFFESCINKSEESLLNSMKALRDYFRSKSFKFIYKQDVQGCLRKTISFYHSEKRSSPGLVKNLIPIPDINKNNNEIHLLPHVHSWFNLMAKVNKKHNSKLANVAFYHDRQDHFDEILLFCAKQIKNSTTVNNFDPTTDFNIKDDITLKFPDSKRSSGVQLADLLAGFTSRYVMDYLYGEGEVDDIYHEIFEKLKEAYNSNSNYGVNFVLPIDRRNVLFKRFNL